MRPSLAPLLLCLLLALPAAAMASGSAPKSPPAQQETQAETLPAPQAEGAQLASLPIHMDKDLAREHESFSHFARRQVELMNANIIGGKRSMQVHRGTDGMYRGSFKAIDTNAVVCQVRRSESNPQYYVGNLIYTEQVLQCVGRSADACHKGPFEPVSEKTSRLIYTSKRGGGWN